MADYRVQMSFPFDSALPRDAITINPHFGAQSPDDVLNTLKNNLDAWAPTAGKPYTLKVYDALKAPPNYPLVQYTNPGTIPNTTRPREIAICLSYYGTYNRPRYRGRLYLPPTWSATASGLRPTQTQIDNAIDFAKSVLKKNLPTGMNWVVFSKTERRTIGGVSDVWVDDEWDTMRSRGLRPTTRTTYHFT